MSFASCAAYLNTSVLSQSKTDVYTEKGARAFRHALLFVILTSGTITRMF